MKINKLSHEFVKHAPENVELGVLYVSIEFATVIHACCCGCGQEVITPLSPTDWKLIFDGETVSLSPSVGNWNFPCRSHYIIKKNQVIEALPWSDEMVQKERHRDSLAKAKHFNHSPATKDARPLKSNLPEKQKEAIVEERTTWGRIKRWWRR